MMNNEIFFDYAYNDSNAYHSLENDLHLKGASLTFPLEAKELGCGISALIMQCKFLLVTTDNGLIDYSHLKIAKDNNIPYCIVACSNYAKVTTCLPKEEHDYIFNYEHSGHRMKLYELLHSHGCIELVNDNSVNYIMTKPTDECFKYDLYISYNRKDFEIATKIKTVLGTHLNVYMADDSSCIAGNFEMMINDAIIHSKNYLILLTKDCLTNYTSWSYELQSIIKEIDSCPSKSILPANIDNDFRFVSYGEKSYPEIVRIMQYSWLLLYTSQYETNCNRIIEVIEGKTGYFSKNEEGTHHDVFLAYARLDKEAGDKVYTTLEKNGFSVWRDVDGLNIGDEFSHVITGAIDKAKVFLLIESKWTKDSSWVKRELEYARNKSKYVICVLTDNWEGLTGIRRLSFSAQSLEIGTEKFEEKLLANLLSKGCVSNTNVILNEGKKLYREIEADSTLTPQTKEKIGRQSFCIFLRAFELGNENARLFIESEAWNINLLEAISQYQEIYANFISDLRKVLYNKGVIIAEDDTISDIPQRGRGMERAAFRYMKRAVNLGYEGSKPEDYDWYYLEDSDFEECYKELGLSSTSEIKNEPDETKEAGNGTVIIDDNSTSILHKENQTEEEESYNVFISCKSEDYDFAQPIHDFLIANGLKVFFADAELKEKAESQYADVIDEALDATKHLIVVATSIGHIKSKWVKYEWSTFSNDLKSNYRDGNLITILSPDITPRMLPASLRHMQSFSIENFENILPYVKK